MRYITVVLENMYKSHNTSAVLRTCDCFGIQDVHIIEDKEKYKTNPNIALGSSKWIDIIKYNNTKECLLSLKDKGYKIVATTPYTNNCSIEDLQINKKTAIVFGNELQGISNTIKENADMFVKIPMYGFTESFNLSVSVALTLFCLTEKIRKSDINWKLTKKEIIDIKLKWAKSSIKSSNLLEQNLKKNI
jgi:tRNA (guanosine-2'-O-)-methyltransferase